MAATLGRRGHLQRGWEGLRRLGGTAKGPRPRQTKADPIVQAVPQADPQDQVELWTTDQHRLGVKPIWRRVWSPRGQRPRAVGQPRYSWGDLYAFVPPGSGRTWWLWLPAMARAAFTLALAEVAKAVGAGQAGERGARPCRLARQLPGHAPSRGACALPAGAVARMIAGRAPMAADPRDLGQSALPRLRRTASCASATLSPMARDAGSDACTDKFPLMAAKCLNTS